MAVSTMPARRTASTAANTPKPTTSGQLAPQAPAAVPRTPPSWDIAQPTASRVGGISARPGATQAQPIQSRAPATTITPPNMGVIAAPGAYQQTPYGTPNVQPQTPVQSSNPAFNQSTNLSLYPYGYDTKNYQNTDTYRPGEAAAYWSERQRFQGLQEQLLGSEFFNMLNGGQPLQKGQIPLIEARMGFDNQELAERDRELGYNQLARAYGNIGQSSGEQAAMAQALQLAQSGGPYNAQYMDQQRGNLRDQSALALEQARMNMSGDFARRGLGGSLLPQQQAQLAQQSSSALQGNLANLESSTALANQQAQLAATGQLSEMSYRESAQRQAIDQLLANLFLDTERQAPDLSNLLVDSENKAKYVGK